MAQKRTSKKMKEEFDKLIDDIKHIEEADIKIIPNYVKNILVKFNELYLKMFERGWDIGMEIEWKIKWIHKKLIDKLLEKE